MWHKIQFLLLQNTVSLLANILYQVEPSTKFQLNTEQMHINVLL